MEDTFSRPNREMLCDGEIRQLIQQGCFAEDWSQVTVERPFLAERVRNTTFSGSVRLGRFDSSRILPCGTEMPCGILNAMIRNSIIGSHCFIRNIGREIVNAEIRERVVLDHVGSVTGSGVSRFGNGVLLAVGNEGGGREIPLYAGLSSSIAFLLTYYQDQPILLNHIKRQIQSEIDQFIPSCVVIGEGTVCLDCGSIQDVCIGKSAILTGVLSLKNGTILSTPESITRVGPGVMATDFIFAEGAELDSHATVLRCFVGQSVRLKQGFSATDSVFFANAEGLNGEAISTFAGPFTVSHHRSSLLLAANYSFFNGGSGCNVSNHLFKTGPVHQGILERGCKMGSGSQLLWPSHIGPFTLITGRHQSHFDTHEFPFSYLIRDQERSLLLPAANLFTAGTLRDELKWKKRDRRAPGARRDLVSPQAFSPFTAHRIILASHLLEELIERKDRETPYVHFRHLDIPSSRLESSLHSYRMAIDWYVGEHLTRFLEERLLQSPVLDPCDAFLKLGSDGACEWLDLGGFLLPSGRLNILFQGDNFPPLSAIEEEFRRTANLFDTHEQEWCFHCWQRHLDSAPLSVSSIHNLVNRWVVASTFRHSKLTEDFHKEFRQECRIGYGLSGAQDAKALDFESVRGSIENNSFNLELKNAMETVTSRANRLREWLPPQE